MGKDIEEIKRDVDKALDKVSEHNRKTDGRAEFISGFNTARKMILNKIIKRECINCEKNLDNDLKRENWHVPLCHEHRIKLMEELTNKSNSGGKE